MSYQNDYQKNTWLWVCHQLISNHRHAKDHARSFFIITLTLSSSFPLTKINFCYCCLKQSRISAARSGVFCLCYIEVLCEERSFRDNLRTNRSILKTFIYRGNIFNKTVNLSYGPHTDITLIQCNYKYTLYNTIGLQCGMLTTNVFWKLRTYQMLKKMKRTCAHITFFLFIFLEFDFCRFFNSFYCRF